MAQLKPIYPTIASSKYSNIAEAHENHFKTNFMNVIEAIKEEINKHLKERQENSKS